MNASEQENMDRLLRENLSGNGFAWSESEWSSFNSLYQKKKKRRIIFWWTTGIFSLTLLLSWGTWAIYRGEEESKLANANNKLPHTLYSPDIPAVKKLENAAPIAVDPPTTHASKMTYRSDVTVQPHIILPQLPAVEQKALVSPPHAIANIQEPEIISEAAPEKDIIKQTPPLQEQIPLKGDSTLPPAYRKNKKPHATVLLYVEPIAMLGQSTLSMEKANGGSTPPNNHTRGFVSNYKEGYGVQIGVKFKKYFALEVGLSQNNFVENYHHTWTENLVVYNNKSYTTLKIDTATGKVNLAPVISIIPRDSFVQHDDKSTNIYSFVQLPWMFYVHAKVSTHWNVHMGIGGATQMMQLKGRNANDLYGYDPTGNLTPPQFFTSWAMKGGLEWKPIKKVSCVLSQNIGWGQKTKDIYHIKLKQSITQVGVRFYINSK